MLKRLVSGLLLLGTASGAFAQGGDDSFSWVEKAALAKRDALEIRLKKLNDRRTEVLKTPRSASRDQLLSIINEGIRRGKAQHLMLTNLAPVERFISIEELQKRVAEMDSQVQERPSRDQIKAIQGEMSTTPAEKMGGKLFKLLEKADLAAWNEERLSIYRDVLIDAIELRNKWHDMGSGGDD